MSSTREPSRAAVHRVLVLVVAFALGAWTSACSGDDADSEPAAELLEDVSGEVVHRGCGTRQRSGEVPRTEENREYHAEMDRINLAIGPVTFRGAKSFILAANFNRRVGRREDAVPPDAWAAFKSVTRVEPETTATVIVPERHRESFLLRYSELHAGDRIDVGGMATRWVRESAGDHAVRFGPCPPAPEGISLDYGGGFQVKEPGCYEVIVVSERDPEPSQATLGFGVGRGGCPSRING